jgi:outer membrane protein OmpA-like peptidoglycan-associated protein
MRMAGDTLVAEGTASARWIASAASAAPMVAGASHVRLDGVRAGLPSALDSIVRELESRRIYFALGSAALDSVARRDVASLATRLATVARAAEREQYRATVELAGRTDPLGTDEGNRALARRRAEAIVAALVPALDRGANVELRAVALGVASPIPGGDEQERARLNRSVSVAVHAEPDDPGTRRGR